MTAAELQQALIDWSVKHSGYDDHRNYIGLSGIADCPKLIFRRYFGSYVIQVKEHLRTRYSYELEGVIKDRLQKMGVLGIGKEISAFQGMVQGHLDGEISGKLLEIKTVPRAEYLPVDRVPRKVYWQTQAYIFYAGYQDALVLYFARDDGSFRAFDIAADLAVVMEIRAKIESVLD